MNIGISTLESPLVKVGPDIGYISRLILQSFPVSKQLLSHCTEWLNKVADPTRNHLLGCIRPDLLPNFAIAIVVKFMFTWYVLIMIDLPKEHGWWCFKLLKQPHHVIFKSTPGRILPFSSEDGFKLFMRCQCYSPSIL